jgi:two-component system sensor histidine kinase DegS
MGLIPALHSFMKGFARRTHIKIRFTASAGVEQLNSTKRTVLYRVAQAALTNVSQHAHAGQVTVNLQKLPGAVRMDITDDGKSFQAERVLMAKRNKRLGLVGMRERIEMVGGSFHVQSAAGHGTTVSAQIPFGSSTTL